MSALGIMQGCFEYFANDSEKQEVADTAGLYLSKVEKIINGGTVEFTSKDFLDMHGFVISIFSGKLDKKGKVVNSKWTDKQWDNVLKQIEECYEKDETFEVTINTK